MAKTGSETIGAPGDKSKMTLFKDDRAEDIGAIIMSVLVIATIMVLTIKPASQPSAPVTPAATTAASAVAPAVAAETVKK